MIQNTRSSIVGGHLLNDLEKNRRKKRVYRKLRSFITKANDAKLILKNQKENIEEEER